jgi:phosphoglycolate phosphatase
LAVFDCDGTLVDSQRSIVAAMHAACDARGLPRPPAEAVRRLVGLPLLSTIQVLFPGIDPDEHARVRTSYAEAYHAMRLNGLMHDPLYPGALDAIAAIEGAGWLLGLATGKSHRGLVATLDSHGIIERFVTLQTADRALGKPHPDMLLKAMSETGAEATATVMIGDTTFDMEMARSAGTFALGVAWGYHDIEDLRAAGAHGVVATFDQLPRTLEALTGGQP